MKQELLDYLNAELSTYVYLDKSIDVNVQEYCKDRSALITNLIAATEQAIFDVPSQEEIERKNIHQCDYCATLYKCDYCAIGFKDGINFILTYNKTEPDGK
jgi:hypothetical protein